MRLATLTIATAVLTLLVVTVTSAEAGSIWKRQRYQQKRIHQGVHSGELTHREAFRLQREQVRINRYKKHAWSDGILTRGERNRIHGQQNRASHRIYRYKHNAWER